MNILFLSLLDMNSLNENNIYSDLLLELTRNDNYVYAVSPLERRNKKKTFLIEGENYKILRNKILNIQKTNLIEKGLSTLLIEKNTIKAIKKYFKGVKFDLILYATPPVTFSGVVKYFKKRDNAKSYLLLKDIFPQNCVDIGLFSKKSIFYKFFRRKEKKLYAVSDRIGCMSPNNVKYLLAHNDLNGKIVEVCPNSLKIEDLSVSEQEKLSIRREYGIPEDKIIIFYGGNLGKPQGINFFVECIKNCNNSKFFFLVVGGGTESGAIEKYIASENPENLKYFPFMPKNEYLKLTSASDVGLVLLDSRFTIPNFPSRSLDYMKARLPLFCVTDENCDLGDIAEFSGFGVKTLSDNVKNFQKSLEKFCNIRDNIRMGENSYEYFCKHYDVKISCEKIINFINGDKQ